MNIKKSGFTLVELLVVMGVMALFGTLIVTIFSRTLKGSNKSQIIGIIKQNGQAILEKMDKTIRNSDKVVCPSNNDSNNNNYKTLMIVKNGIYTRYRFIIPTLTVNGSIQQDNPTKELVGIVGDTDYKLSTDPAFINKLCASSDQLISPVTLTDTNSQTGVSVDNGSFIINQSAGFMDQVTINFDIKPGVKAPESVTGQIDAVNFKTTIQLR